MTDGRGQTGGNDPGLSNEFSGSRLGPLNTLEDFVEEGMIELKTTIFTI
jgi:hypothetical protein